MVKKGRLAHEQVLEALEVRFDHLSARTMFEEALQRADIAAAAHYSPEEASRLAWALTELGERSATAVKRLLEFAGHAATHDVKQDPDEEDLRLLLN
jgi:hypothetical protein